jgi:hypothetical protein
MDSAAVRYTLVVLAFVVIGIAIGRISYALSGRRHKDEITTEQRRRNVGTILGHSGSSGVTQPPGGPRNPSALSEDDFYR